MTTIYQFPTSWYRFVSRRFPLSTASQVTPMPLLGIKKVARGASQLWQCQLSMAVQADPDWQEIEAFFHRLDGQSGAIRIGDPFRRRPWYNRNLAATQTIFSDGTTFTDGTGFADGYLPPFVTAYATAAKGASFVTMAGFPASIAAALTRGDIFEHRPNGIAAQYPLLYEVMHGNATNSSGQAGVEIRPRLRFGVAVGDQFVLQDATTVMRMIDDGQGVAEVGLAAHGSIGFSLVEALDLVP